MGDGGTGATGGDGVNRSHVLFDNFVQASTFKGTLKAFQELCDHLEVKPTEYRVFYHKLKSKLNYWKAKALWAKLDKRASHKEYKKGRACANSKCLIIGAGPCGLRTAIELAFLGAKVVLLEKRDAFSRNNVLHLWPFTIQDLRGLGAKKFYGKFCAGAIDHISIRQLQLMLLKMALLLGIEIHVNVEFKGLIEPPEDQETERIGWRAEVHPKTHPASELEFDVIIGADGRRNTLPGFRRKEFRGKLAIAITANFINRNTTAEAKVEEISGVAFIFNQKFFQDLREATGIDLENIVYYKDDTHYFVMTAKKQSLLEKGVILHDYADTELLLSRANVDQAALLSYAREAADFSTSHQLPTLDFAINHYGQPDVAMFDFTCMYASENAAMVRQRNGHKLLVALVGDSLLEPFWPMGTGIARGFLAAMDSGWMVKSWAQGKTPLEVLAERESIYRLLPQTTPENVSKNFSHYSVDPTTRYPNISLNFLKPSQMRHLFDTGESREMRIEIENVINTSTPKLARNENCLLDKQLQESVARSSKLLNWCQRQTEGYRNVNVTDLTMSWKSGLALCALIHRYRPDLIDFDSLDERDQEKNNQLGFDVAEKEFGISPCMTGKEMSSVVEPDKLSMVMYLSQFYEMFKDTVPPGDNHNLSPEEKAALIASTKSPISFLSKLGQSIAISRKRNPKQDKKEKDVDGLGKRRKTSQSEDEEVSRTGRDDRPSVPAVLSERKMDCAAAGNHNKVKVMATQLLAKFEENAPAQHTGLKRQGESLPNLDRLLPPSPPQTPVNEPVRLAPVPAWRKARSGADQLSSSGSRSCPKKTILLPSSSSTSSLSLHSEGSLRKEFPVNIGGSDVCFFCRKRVYVMERLSAEGKFFHRSCFKCDYCGTTLRLSSYAFDVEDGKFYCKPHYCYRLSGYAQRKRPAPSPAPITAKENQVPQTPTSTVDAPGRAMAAAAPSAELQPSAPEVNGLQEPSLAKRLRGTPERIELENYRVSLQREEELEEVPEETLAEHNLSSVLDKATDADLGSSSSESDMEEEDEQEDQDQEEVEVEVEQQQLPSPSDLGGVPWKEAVELHAKLRGDLGDEGEGEGEGEPQGDAVSRDGEVDEEEEDEEEEEEDEDEEDDEESSDEGDYCPWDRELQSGLWLDKYLTDEEDVGTFKARNLQIQQALQPVDPQAIPGLVRTHLDSDGDKDGLTASASQLSQPSELTQPSSTEPGEDEDLEAEADSPDIEPGTEMDQDDIPSDAEAEARLHQSEHVEALPEEDKKSESVEMASSIEPSSSSPVQKEDVILSPLKPSPGPETHIPLVKSPGTRFFPEPFIPEETKPDRTTPSPAAKSPPCPSPAPVHDHFTVSSPISPPAAASPVNVSASSPPSSPSKSPIASPLKPAIKSPVRSPVKSPVSSPIRSQPTPLPETCPPKSPVYPHRSICPLTGNPLSPICAQPLPCQEPSSPLTSDSPVRTQPVPAVTSTPMTKADEDTSEHSKSIDSSTEETPSKKTDIIEEFWLKSAEIRKSLGLTPLDRSSKILEKSVVKAPTQEPTPVKTQSPDVSEEQKPAFTGRAVIRRLNITLEGQVITPIAPAEPKSNGSDKRDLSSSSGLGLNGSLATSQMANSDSYNMSDSTMLTPPSSPPPPVPANQSPAVLRQQRHQVSWSNGTEKPPPERAKEPAKTKNPVPTPRTQLSPVSAPKPAPRKVPSPQAEPEAAPVVVMREKKKPRPVEMRKSFVETVEEIPFADDVEETYDERTPETSMNRYYTPPTSKPSRERPPLHLALAMENGKPNIQSNQASKTQRATQFSPEAKEIAEERMRAREKSVKSQALKDAMAKQLNKMKESDVDKGASPKVAWSVTPDTAGKSKKSVGSPKTSAVKALESKKAETIPERFFSSNKSLDSSVASSDGSSTSKSKKRSSLFSPRKNKKEKKAKNDSSRVSGTDETPPKHKSLWKAVFSGYKKDKKKKDDKSCPSTPSSSSTTQDSGKRTSPPGRSSDLKSRRNLSFSEDSDLSCDDVLERSSQKSKADSVYVPHALAFKRSYATKKTYTEEELNAKLTRRVQKAARRQAKQEELKRLHRAQIIQRQLEQVEEKQRQLEERGVAVEKALRGEAGLYKGTYTLPKQHKRRSDYWGDSNYSEILDLHLGVEPFVGMPRRRPLSFCPCCSPEGMGKKDDPKLMQEWFKLVQEKNALVRYESELMIFARELELEDRQSRLQQELRERMAVEDHLKTEKELAQEKQILNEMLEVVEQRDALVALLEEQRLREKEEDKDLEAVMLSKGFNLNWA
ncbi:protein-methionine sulfoxide oxidase mical3a isoform X1 [Seriola aureovittata]|uniref:protein-methionine sulfoxide oxidase mical3a isoform X1 n=1 Tax=Seriola aureovittata TaxID=2871759 RepID=UPI0024BE6021|nr:protein-methionine sulfoxide oxidase mical3a isoform X1 [Seriola aureovittata]XP_056243939.1 protein-methionine sulfoxide oxidase mical3a isoform X1 [Seriola aureovittata]XP_056243940.1 protein-methionine sulfoxide oxidase mical3a isoform X1 [Seriola aureovittata]